MTRGTCRPGFGRGAPSPYPLPRIKREGGQKVSFLWDEKGKDINRAARYESPTGSASTRMNSPDSTLPKKRRAWLTILGIGFGVVLLVMVLGVVLSYRALMRQTQEIAAAVPPDSVQPSLEEVIASADVTATPAPPPAWVPAYPGATVQGRAMTVEKQDTIAGAFTAKTPDAADKVKGFFESQLKENGFEIEAMPANAHGSESAVVSARRDADKRTITVLINREQEMTALVVDYEGPKP